MQIMQSRNDLTIINFPASLALSSAALKRFQATRRRIKKFVWLSPLLDVSKLDIFRRWPATYIVDLPATTVGKYSQLYDL
jgi:hypothetical protein